MTRTSVISSSLMAPTRMTRAQAKKGAVEFHELDIWAKKADTHPVTLTFTENVSVRNLQVKLSPSGSREWSDLSESEESDGGAAEFSDAELTESVAQVLDFNEAQRTLKDGPLGTGFSMPVKETGAKVQEKKEAVANSTQRGFKDRTLPLSISQLMGDADDNSRTYLHSDADAMLPDEQIHKEIVGVINEPIDLYFYPEEPIQMVVLRDEQDSSIGSKPSATEEAPKVKNSEIKATARKTNLCSKILNLFSGFGWGGYHL